MKKQLLSVLLFVLAVSVTFALPQEKKQFNVEPGKKLVVDFECGSDVIVEGWEKNVVDVDVDISGRDAGDVEIKISETSYGVLISAEYSRSRNSRSTSGEVKVKVPNKFNIELKTTGGELVVKGVEGDLEGTTMGGSLELSSLKGKVEFSTMGGTIELKDSEVDGEVSTMGGNVLIENVVGDVDASTMGGSVTQKNVKGSKSSIGDEVKIKSMGGSINVDEGMNGVNVSTMGGGIKVKRAAKYVKASTMGGDITIDEIDGWVDVSTMGGDIQVNLTGSEGERNVKMSSMSGDITLTVPSDLDMDIEIEIVYEEDDRDEIGVESDFSLSERIEDRDEGDQDTKKLIATGKTGSANNKIRISTVSGKVYLKKG